ncbi:hypothetical protein CVT23_18980 [Minwuia thermotolerans]|uniref:Uncharacterized protein n=2 Tax=Minwuia thermotolerans TaxID=2056226 RepID=A0A2M9FXC4_9PROT|nr:hypothetical protein CVT23_18980 [Minwuia thermotolerans]
MALALAVGCAATPPEPSMTVRTIDPESDGLVRLSFSTDSLAQNEAQELLLVVAAIVTRRAGRERFQFRSVEAEGLIDTQLSEIRYFDVDAVVATLADAAAGDPARKTYAAASVLEYFRPKYAPILPRRLRDMLSARADPDRRLAGAVRRAAL